MGGLAEGRVNCQYGRARNDLKVGAKSDSKTIWGIRQQF